MGANVEEEVWLVSVDDHVVEPPDTWQARVPKSLADEAPRIVDLDGGGVAWFFEGQTHPIHGMLAVVTDTDARGHWAGARSWRVTVVSRLSGTSTSQSQPSGTLSDG